MRPVPRNYRHMPDDNDGPDGSSQPMSGRCHRGYEGRGSRVCRRLRLPSADRQQWLARTRCRRRHALAPDPENAFTSGGSGFFTGIIGRLFHGFTFQRQTRVELATLELRSPHHRREQPLSGESPGPLAGTLDPGGGTTVSVARWSSDQAAILLLQTLSQPPQLSKLDSSRFEVTPPTSASMRHKSITRFSIRSPNW